MVTTKTRAIFMGTPAFALPILETTLNVGCNVVGVFTRPDKPVGRGRRVEESPMKVHARSLGLPVFQPPSLRDPGTMEEIASLSPEVMIVAAYGRIIPEELLALCPQSCLNVHPSLLPRHRGPSPVSSAILLGEPVTGVSLFLMDAGMDTGPVLASQEELIHPDDTAWSLTNRLFLAGSTLLRAAFSPWLAGDLRPRPQDHQFGSLTKLLTKQDGELDWRLTAGELDRQVRAYFPWPGAYTSWNGKRLKVLRVTPGRDGPRGEPGRVMVSDQEGGPLVVVTGQGLLSLESIQIEGRRAMTGAEFLRGHPEILGTLLPN